MTLTVTPQASPLAGRLIQENNAGPTPDVNVTGGAGTLYLVDVDNSLNTQATYVKIYDSPSPAVGSTPANLVLRAPANVRTVFSLLPGIAFTNLSFAAVTGADQTSVAAPVSAVTVRVVSS